MLAGLEAYEMDGGGQNERNERMPNEVWDVTRTVLIFYVSSLIPYSSRTLIFFPMIPRVTVYWSSR